MLQIINNFCMMHLQFGAILFLLLINSFRAYSQIDVNEDTIKMGWNKLLEWTDEDVKLQILSESGVQTLDEKSIEEINEKKHKTNLGLISDKELIDYAHRDYSSNMSKWRVVYKDDIKTVEEYENSDYCSCEKSQDSILISVGSKLFHVGNQILLEYKNSEIKNIRFNEKYHYYPYDKEKGWPPQRLVDSFIEIRDYKIVYKERPKWEEKEKVIGQIFLETVQFDPVNKFPRRFKKLKCYASIAFKCEVKKMVRFIK